MIIAFAGDWHGNQLYARKAIQFAAKSGADVLLHVGDFGFWPQHNGNDPFVNNVSKIARDADIEVRFVDGNHENHWVLRDRVIATDTTPRGVYLADNLYYLPRGFRFTLDSVKFLALGGAHSVDRDARIEGFDWFKDETISLGDAYRACEPGLTDVMITHDCPSGVDIPFLRKTKFMVSQTDADLTDRHRSLLRNVVDVVMPKLLVHGHYHCHYGRILDGDGFRTRIVGLDCDGSPLNENIIVVDTADLGVVQ